MITISKQHMIYTMSAENAPICTVPQNTDICFQTCDCFADQITSADVEFKTLNWDKINPATGPVYIEGAEVGDILKINIKKIILTSQQAVMVTLPNLGVIGNELTESSINIVNITHDQVRLPGGIERQVEAMIGVIGVAPADEAISCGTPGRHGGNMDAKVIREGSTLWLPVNVAGALLALGDLHAGMGDGEVSGCGLEIAGEVILSVEVIKNKILPLPLVLDSSSVHVLASEKTVDDASTQATRLMAHWLSADTKLSSAEAISLMSIVGDLSICQVVDPLKTCRFSMPREVLNQLGITL